ncbi:MAG: hypothetical protein KGL39_56985 [Patescibacteria group bacterium]|nr:hypothetical protein [Patescibacteria group bacterium]
MTDQLALDAAFLAGFIAGQYDIKGEAQPPVFLMPVIESVLKNGDAAFRKDADSLQKLPIASPPLDKPESVQPVIEQTTPAAASMRVELRREVLAFPMPSKRRSGAVAISCRMVNILFIKYPCFLGEYV